MSESTIGVGFRMLTRLTPLQMKLAIFQEISPDFSRVFPIFSSDLLKKTMGLSPVITAGGRGSDFLRLHPGGEVGELGAGG